MATIPVLSLSDLKEKPEPLPMAVTKRGNTTVLRHETDSSLLHLHAYFSANDLKVEELPALVALTMVLGTMGTKRRSGKELQMLVKQKIGRLSFQPVVLPGSDADHCCVLVSAMAACLADRGESAVTLLTLCEALDDIIADNAVCVVAGQSQMDGCGDRIASRRVL